MRQFPRTPGGRLMALPRLNTPQSARRLMQTTEHRLAAYLVGSLTLAMLVTFVTLDLQAMRRESSHPSPVTDTVHAWVVSARVLVAGD